jgi:hypothetical protein
MKRQTPLFFFLNTNKYLDIISIISLPRLWREASSPFIRCAASQLKCRIRRNGTEQWALVQIT